MKNALLILTISSTLLAACGQTPVGGVKPATSTQMEPGLTGAVDSEGRAYTSYVGQEKLDENQANLQAMRAKAQAERSKTVVSERPAISNATTLAPQAETIDTSVLEGLEFSPTVLGVSWKLKLRLGEKLIEVPFTAPWWSNDNKFYAIAEAHANGLTSDVLCQTKDFQRCSIAATYKGNDFLKVEYIKEARTARFKTSGENFSAFPGVLNFDNPAFLLRADVLTWESHPGVSHIEIQFRNGIHVVGDLKDANGDCVPMEIRSSVKGISSACLAGNDLSGDLVIQFTGFDGRQEFTYWMDFVKPSTGRETALQTAQAGFAVHPVIKTVMTDFENPNVLKEQEEFWLNGKASTYRRFMKLYEEAQTKPKDDASKSFATMLNILKNNSMPLLLSMKVLVESYFTPNLTSKAGAVGYWQFMPDTASRLGLALAPVDERTRIAPSTRAAVKYMKELLEDFPWRSDLKMALAAYNMGEYGLLKKTEKLEATMGGAKGSKSLSMEELTEYSLDFWNLHSHRMLPVETRHHVCRILAAMSMSTKPERFDLPYKAFPLD